MTKKLLDHFKRMQEMATAYITPEPYQSQIAPQMLVGTAEDDRDAFVNDIIYMLDGPEQREAQAAAELVVSQGYPTEDAYMGAMRALHWRTEQLRQAGIEPLNLMELNGEAEVPHYPPDHFRFPITECFPGDDHRQVYHAWRRFPRAMQASIAMGVVVAFPLGVILTLLLRS